MESWDGACVLEAMTGGATDRDVFDECDRAWLLCHQPALAVGLEEQVDGSVSATQHTGLVTHCLLMDWV